MKLPIHTNRIDVFYDGRCGMCCTFSEWLNQQERAYAVRCLPYQAADAEEVFPELDDLDPAREMVVRTDEGEIFRGAEGWVMCLYSCAQYRAVARKLARPYMLPVAKKACALLAKNRHALSKVLFRKKDKEVRAELHTMKGLAGCNEGFCQVEH